MRRVATLLAVLLAAIALGFAIAGCGADDSVTADETSKLCVEAQSTIVRAKSVGIDETNSPEYARVLAFVKEKC